MIGVAKFLLLLLSIIIGWALGGVLLFSIANRFKGRNGQEAGPGREPDPGHVDRGGAGLSFLDRAGSDAPMTEEGERP